MNEGSLYIYAILVILCLDEAKISNGAAVAVLVLICIFVSGFAWSWGPLGWLVSSLFPAKIVKGR